MTQFTKSFIARWEQLLTRDIAKAQDVLDRNDTDPLSNAARCIFAQCEKDLLERVLTMLRVAQNMCQKSEDPAAAFNSKARMLARAPAYELVHSGFPNSTCEIALYWQRVRQEVLKDLLSRYTTLGEVV